MPGESELGLGGGPGLRGQVLAWGGHEVRLFRTPAPGDKATPPVVEMATQSAHCGPRSGGGSESFFLPEGLVPLSAIGCLQGLSCGEGKTGAPGRPTTS